MKVSIIIPTYNRNDLLGKCLEKLSPVRQTVLGENYEVIVSDDSKENNAKPFIEKYFPWVKYTAGPHNGPAANRNNAAKQAEGEWLLFTDDDCIPDENWISSYLDAIEKYKDFSVLEGYTTADRPKNRFDEEAPINTKGNNLWSCNFAIKKEIFLQLDGFDESFPFAAMEDIDFHARVLSVTKIRFVPEAIIIHPWRRIVPFKSIKKHYRSISFYYKKHPPENWFRFRWQRVKIFVGSVFTDFKELYSYSMRGWKIYFEKIALNFLLIFI